MFFSRRYALLELQKDVQEELLRHPEAEREALLAATKFATFVVHNKKKPKLAEIPTDTPFVYCCRKGHKLIWARFLRYFSGADVGDVW